MGNLFGEYQFNIFRRGEQMKKDEFLAKLKSLLMDIPVDERKEALAYYRS